MTIQVSLHDPISARSRVSSDTVATLSITDGEWNEVAIFCPADVAEATAQAFNAAMDAHKAASEVSA